MPPLTAFQSYKKYHCLFIILCWVNTIKGDVTTLRNETESLKNQSQTVFNNIATATSSAVQTVQIEGATQVTNVQSAVAEQVAEATSQANRAEQATSTKVNTDLSNITKDIRQIDRNNVVYDDLCTN